MIRTSRDCVFLLQFLRKLGKFLTVYQNKFFNAVLIVLQKMCSYEQKINAQINKDKIFQAQIFFNYESFDTHFLKHV